MARRMVAAIAAAVWVVLGLAVLAAPAGAGGGSRLVPDEAWYRPGDVVHLTASVTKLDLDWFGPYTAYLRPVGDTSAVEPGTGANDIPIGRLVVTRLDPNVVRAELTFVLPKVSDGQWWVGYCSPGCTRMLGDLMGGNLQVGEVPVAPPTTAAPTTVAPPSTVRPTTTVRALPATTTAAPTSTAVAVAPAEVATATSTPTDDGGSRELATWAAGSVVVAVLGAAAVLARRWGGGRRTITASAVPIDPGPEGGGAGGVASVVVERVPSPSPSVDDESIGAGW